MESITPRGFRLIPDKPDQLLAQGDLIAAALMKHELAIGVKQNTAAAVQSDLANYRRLDSLFQAQREDRKKKLTPEQRAVDALARDLIKQTKNMVTPEFGATFNQSHTQMGYVSNLSMPRHLNEREAMVERIATFLAANPRFENEKVGVTAARALALHQRFIAARSATSNGKAETRTLSSERKAARTQLKKRLTALVGELKLLLPADDARWQAFGLTPPADRRAALKAARAAKKRTTEIPPAAEAPRAPSDSGEEAQASANGAHAELSA